MSVRRMLATPIAKDLILHTFTVVAEAHLGLAEANGVFALAHTIELLEFCLVDTLFIPSH